MLLDQMCHVAEYAPAKTGEYLSGTSHFSNLHVAKNISRMINTVASIWYENVLGYFSLDIMYSIFMQH